MSEFHCEVVEIGKIGTHPNANTLSITNIHGGYPVIIKTGSFKTGDKAIYIPVDALVPLKRPEFHFLKKSPEDPRTHERIKAKKLRGIFSMGLLIPAFPGAILGQNVQTMYDIEKWEPQSEAITTGGECERDQSGMPVYTDLEGLRKYRSLLVPGEDVVITEKIHGANARYVWHNERLWVGSHRQVKREDPNNLWWKAAIRFKLTEKLKEIPDKVLFGEVFGCVQAGDGLGYGSEPGEVIFRVFDVFDIQEGRYLSYPKAVATAESIGLQWVPVLYEGPWSEDLMNLSEGQTTFRGGLDKPHVREGFVVSPVCERWDERVGRVKLKMVGEGYHLRKER